MTEQKYVPSTFLVRLQYSRLATKTESEQELEDEFDRWYDAEIAAAEQRGAIKALREAATQMESTADTLSDLWEHYMLPGDIIAWIRHRADLLEGDE